MFFYQKKYQKPIQLFWRLKNWKAWRKIIFAQKKHRRICIIVTFTLSIFSGAWLRVKRFGQKTRLEPLLCLAYGNYRGRHKTECCVL